MKTYKTIDVLISTFGVRLYDLKNVILEPKKGVRYLIGHQCGNKEDKNLFLDRDDIIYYPIDSVGVTKSRNFLLEKSDSDICYFCDDDIVMTNDFDLLLFNAHRNDPSAVITFRVDDENGNPRKKYPNKIKSYRNIFNILAIGTIEVSIKRESLNGIRFCEYMGAGTNIPIGDEAVLLADFIKNKKQISFHNKSIASHPIESSGGGGSQSTIYSRGVTIRKVYGFLLGIPVSIVFLILRKKLLNKPSLYIGIKSFLLGFSLYNINKLIK